MMRPGSILREVDSQEAFIVLASLKWALLCWPVIQAHDDAINTYRLSVSGPLSWQFVWHVDHHVACQPLPKMVQDVGVTFELSTWESPVKACLRCSTDLVFQELQYLAPYLGMAEPGSYSRIELVQTMAALVGDDEFVREVLAKEEAKMKKRKKIKMEKMMMTQMMRKKMSLISWQSLSWMKWTKRTMMISKS